MNLKFRIEEKYLRIICVIFFLIIGILFFARKINLVTADLGRHIRNGEIFITENKVLSHNYYSYTQPNLEVVNHHWLSGVIYYFIWRGSGFVGLSLMQLGLIGLTLYLVFKQAEKKSNWLISLLLSYLALPIMATRTEIRPEFFSYLFLVIFYKIFDKYKEKVVPHKICLLLIFLQIIWVNSHIYWILGYFLVWLFGVFKLLWIKDKKVIGNGFLMILVLILVSFINPFGYKIVLEPFLIFRDYGYTLVENMSVLFMQKRFGGITYIWIEIWSLVWLLGLGFKIWQSKWKFKNFFIEIIITIVFLVLAFKMNRNFPIWSIFFVIILSGFIGDLIKRINRVKVSLINQSVTILLVLCFFVIILSKNNFFSFSKPNFGIGLVDEVNKSVEFVKTKNIKGPLMNNYDIGGYLIYNLYDQEKVFIDNRPEAYSLSFMDKYKRINEEKIWEEFLSDYNFNVIYFYRNDMTNWGQEFLVNRIKDWQNWSPIFVDNQVIILIRRKEENLRLIETYELPKKIFRIEENK